MIDPQAAAELAIFDALTTGVTLAQVYQDVVEGTPAPVVIVADLAGDPIGGKGSRSMQLDLTIYSEVWAEARAPLLALQAEVKAALDGARLTNNDFSVRPTFDTSDARQVAVGQYAGNSHFTVFVTPA